MASNFKTKADTLQRRDDDPGYHVAWKYKYRFEKGAFTEELHYRAACETAARLQAAEPDKVFWAELGYE